jgi:vacuolar-type H+-ATPase subunit E/Vma4
MDPDSRLTAQLAPLAAALMDAAQTQADASLRQAQATASLAIAEGTSRARAVLEEAGAEGRRAAERAAQHRLVEGRRRARRLILGAQDAVYQRFVCEAIRAAEELCRHHDYVDLERRMKETAKTLLGPDATIIQNPGGLGGVCASNGGRAVDLTLAALARQCIDDFGEDVTRLWV